MHVALYDSRDRKVSGKRIAWVVPSVAHAWAAVLMLEHKVSKHERAGYIGYIKNAIVPESGVLPDSDFHQQNANDFNAFWNVFGYSCEVYKGERDDERWADDVTATAYYWAIDLPPEATAPTPAQVESPRVPTFIIVETGSSLPTKYTADEAVAHIVHLEQQNAEMRTRISEANGRIDEFRAAIAQAHDIINRVSFAHL